jgi:hypothetical protein
MRFVFVVLLLAVTLLDVAHAELTNAKLIASSPLRSVPDAVHEVTYKRLLRSGKQVNEERAVPVSGLTKVEQLSKVQMAKNWVTTKLAKLKSWYTTRRKVQGWMKKGSTPEDVFKLLKLDEGTETLMANPSLNLWVKFLVTYNKKNRDKMMTMIGVFTKTYGDEAVAKMLETARRNPSTYKRADSLQGQQRLGWANTGIRDPDIIFQLLKVGDTSVTKLFSNPNFNVWYYFFTRMNRYNSDREVTMINKLVAVYDDIPLAKAIEAARQVKTAETLPKNVQSVENIATNFQNAQFKKWLEDGTEPATIFTKLGMDKLKWSTDPNAEIYSGYKAFYDASKTLN